MLKSKRLNVLIPHQVTIANPDLIHVGTRVQIAEQTDMDHGDLLVDKTVRTPDDIKRVAIDLEIDTESNIYVRYGLIFQDRNTQQEIEGNFSVISSINGDQEGFKYNNVIISTPYVKSERNTSSLNNQEMKISLEGFQVLVGVGKHKSTSWSITEDNGKEIFKREKDEDNLTSITVPYSLFENTKLYFLKAKYITDTNGNSNFGCYVLNTSTTEKFKYELEPILPFLYGQSLYYKASYKSSNIKQIGLIVKQVLGDVEVEVYRKDDYLPSRSLKIPGDNLVEGALYRTYSYCKVLINGQVLITSTVLYHTFTYLPNRKHVPSTDADYPGKYTKLNPLVTGAMVNVSRELKNGIFLIGKNSSDTFSIYGRYNNTVRDTGLEVELPEKSNGDLFVPYVNVLPLYNDQVMINYSIYKKGTKYRNSIWALYDVDLVRNTFTLVKHKMFPDELFSTAMNSSAVVAKDNSIYYIPARYEKQKGTPDFLPIFKLEYKNLDLVRTEVKEVALPNVYRNLTLCPTGDQPLGQEEFLILGGTDKDGTPIVDPSGNQTGMKQYQLLNRNVYKFRTNKDYTHDSLEKIGELPQSFNLEKYSLSAFLRKDGKIVVFNNTDTGSQMFHSVSFTLDLTQTGNHFYKEEQNESTIDLPFRTTLIGNNGDFIRISYRDDLLMYPLLYPHLKLASYDDDIITMNKNLVVPIGRTVTIENPYIYETIVIEGTDDQNTGILRWADQNFVRTLTYKDKIITRDTIVTQAEADLIPKQHLWVLDGVTYTIKG